VRIVFYVQTKVFLQQFIKHKAQVQLNTQMLQSQSKLLQDLMSVAGKGGLEAAINMQHCMHFDCQLA